MQLQHARRWSKTRSVLLGKWPKCSQFSGRLYVGVFKCSWCCCAVFMCVVKMGALSRFSIWNMVQGSLVTCLPASVFPAERRVKMCWRLKAWRPLACCQAGFSLEASRHCRVVSARLSISLFSTLYSIFFLISPSPFSAQPLVSLSPSFTDLNIEPLAGFVFQPLSDALITFK